MPPSVTFTPSPSLTARLAAAAVPFMGRVAVAVAAEARKEAPVGEPDPLGRPRRARPMRETIVPFVSGTTAVVQVNSRHFLAVHQGSRPHPITPRGKGYPLRFYWKKVGGEVRAMRVNHPGTQPNPFLVRAARTVLARMR